MTQKALSISVIICAYTEKRWDNLSAAVKSVQQQTLPATEIIIAVDHNPVLLKRVQDHIAHVIVVENKGAKGLSDTRNSGISVAKGQIIAFLDDDAIATPNWLMFLLEAFSDPQIIGAGGPVIPLWSDSNPFWLPEEFHWVVGCTYRGMPQNAQMIRNPIGANMSFRKEVFDAVGDFRSEIGRVGCRPFGCEETELCIRARQYWPERGFLYQPQATVFHHVPGNRTNWHYFFSRCYSEGISKANVSRYVGTRDSLASERAYTFRTLPQGVKHGLIDALFHHDPGGFARAGAISAGLVVTMTGYLIGSTLLRISRSKSDVSREIVFRSAETTPHTLSTRVGT